ncbi:MAG: TorF family putative porin [Gammaproteobacteria bacterium]|nr:TorF family putative porin [Gammaproteobacteria bacterium]
MRSLAAVSALAIFGLATTTHAEITGTAAVTSDYDFRGVSLSDEDPAFQASIDYAHDNGFYASLWGSSIDYGPDYDGTIEIDLGAGLSGETELGIGWDVGLVWYAYPDSDSSPAKLEIEDYGEAYLGGSYKMLDAKVWYTDDYGDTGDDAWYTELNASFELPAGLTLDLHIGQSFGDYWDAIADDAESELETTGIDGDYTDWSIGLGYTVGYFDLNLRYVDTDTDSDLEVNSGAFANDSRVVFTVSTSFPWAN